MRQFFSAIFLTLLFIILAPGAFAQARYVENRSFNEHANVGLFGELFRVNQNSVNLAGVGARLSVNLRPRFQLEAETSYDFDQIFTEVDTTGATILRTSFRAVTGLFGPKLETNRGPVRLFLTVKGGAVGFHFGNGPATVGQFASTVSNLRAQDVSGAFYPGGGVEAFWGPFGLRFDVGDEMYFNSGVHHNLRATFGPTIRF